MTGQHFQQSDLKAHASRSAKHDHMDSSPKLRRTALARGIGAFKAQAVQANCSSMTRQTNSNECTLFPAASAQPRLKLCDSKILLVSRLADRPTNRERNIV